MDTHYTGLSHPQCDRQYRQIKGEAPDGGEESVMSAGKRDMNVIDKQWITTGFYGIPGTFRTTHVHALKNGNRKTTAYLQTNEQGLSTMRNPYILPKRREAFRLGYQDGYEQPTDLSMGITWDNDMALNNAYDYGVNAGQRARAAALGIIAQCDELESVES